MWHEDRSFDLAMTVCAGASSEELKRQVNTGAREEHCGYEAMRSVSIGASE